MNHLHTTLPILCRFAMLDGVRVEIPLSEPFFKKITLSLGVRVPKKRLGIKPSHVKLTNALFGKKMSARSLSKIAGVARSVATSWLIENGCIKHGDGRNIKWSLR